jgi:hypothetical protein
VACRALVCRCRRASAAVVGGPIQLHAPYVTSTTLTTRNDDIPTHATICRQRLPLASTTHHSCYSCCQRLPPASPTYYYPPMLCTTPFLQWIAGRLPVKTPAENMHKAHTNTTWYAHGEWRRRTDNIQAQALSAMQAQGPFASVLKAPLSSLDATYKKVQMAPFPPQCQCKRN